MSIEYKLHAGRKFFSDELADITNGTDATYYYYVDCTEKDSVSFEGVMNCVAGTVTLTIEGTMQDDGTAAASCTYTDITLAMFGVASVVSAAASQAFQLADDDSKSLCYRYIRVKIVANSGVNTGDWLVRTLCVAR